MKPTSLNILLNKVKVVKTIGHSDCEVTFISQDSNKIENGNLFAAIRGTQTDGHKYIEKAITNGAIAILCEELPDSINDDICYIQVEDVSYSLGIMASAFFSNPTEYFNLIGITGTNGKTTTATLLFKLYRNLGHSCGLISTIVNRINEQEISTTHTTPDTVTLQSIFYQMKEAGCDYVFMEVSSHSIIQNRISGTKFTGLIFTNITHDHLDYHKTFSEYIKAKKRLFDLADSDTWALTNKDDRNGLKMLENTNASRYTYSLEQPADFNAKIMELDFNGLLLKIGGKEAWFSITGRFNAYNLLAVYSAAILLGKDSETVITALSSLSGAKGRFEYIHSEEGIHGIIDYAHTPDALQNVLQTILELREKDCNLITVVGCGGNRDQGKRPLMGELACRFSDRVIFTSDNPRDEVPESIIDAMASSVPSNHSSRYIKISDRAEAIKTAVALAIKGDIILIAGKGHENYQEIMGKRIPFDDKQELIKQFNRIHK